MPATPSRVMSPSWSGMIDPLRISHYGIAHHARFKMAVDVSVERLAGLEDRNVVMEA